ncbi:MAG: hypothetical protein HFG72_01975 [Hungatella sp.]|jgi:hypothetical protein|nr:hypothetical protein [Hungatella sp.]
MIEGENGMGLLYGYRCGSRQRKFSGKEYSYKMIYGNYSEPPLFKDEIRMT